MSKRLTDIPGLPPMSEATWSGTEAIKNWTIMIYSDRIVIITPRNSLTFNDPSKLKGFPQLRSALNSFLFHLFPWDQPR